MIPAGIRRGDMSSSVQRVRPSHFKQARVSVDDDSRSAVESPSKKRRTHNGMLREPMATPKRVRASELPIVNVPAELLDANQTQAKRFSPGAIIAMRLVNLQVARDATYRFQPYLNMILGSNGTGKSTVATAMFLLFQGSIKDLGRKTYDDFVTMGQPVSVISAVMQSVAMTKKTNSVVAMRIPADSNGGRLRPQWYIDGAEVSESAFAKFVASQKIHVNNLSQFLPQMRIASFAGLSPENRLRSIEEAVGYEGMLDDHDMLADQGNELVKLHQDIEFYTKRLGELEKQQKDTEEKISKLGSVEEEKGELEFLTHVLRVAEYQAVQKELAEMQATLSQKRQDLEAFDADHAYVQNEIDDSESQISNLEGESLASDEVDDAAMSKKAQLLRQTARLKKGVETVKMLRSKLQKYEKEIHEADSKRRDARVRVMASRAALNKLGDTDKFAQSQTKLATLQNQEKAVMTRKRAVEEEEDILLRKFARAEQNITKITSQLTQLQAAQNRHRSPREVSRILEWDRGKLERAVGFVRSHRDKFKMAVIEPAIISVDILDERVAPAIAAAVSVPNMLKFICQTREDQQTLMALSAEEDIDVKAVFNDGSNTPTVPENVRQALKRNGFEGVLSDMLSGPAPMLSYLSDLSLGSIPYSLSPRDASARANVKTLPFRWKGIIDSRSHYSFTKSTYGKRLETETSRSIEPKPWAKFMLRRDTTKELNSLSEQLQSQKRDAERQNEEIASARLKMAELDAQTAASQEELIETLAFVKRFKKEQTDLQRSVDDERRFSERLQDLQRELQKLRDRSSANLKELQLASKDIGNEGFNLDRLLGFLQSTSRMSMSQIQRQDFDNKRAFLASALADKRNSCETAVSEMEAQISERQEETRRQHREADESTSWLRAHTRLKEGITKARETPCAELQAEVGRRQALVEIHDTQGESLAVVQRRLNDIIAETEEQKLKLTKATSRRDSIDAKVAAVRDRWVTALESMVQESSNSFSKMFKELNCRGFVTIDKRDPLAVGSWGLDIKVAFRHGEREQNLSRNRQSGGERSVTTAIFLMSLQSMTQSPFRVLDEINQGMDKYNETRTMAFIVKYACDRDKGQQYFVITPKLLFDMPYHRKMSVNFIISSNAIAQPNALISSVEQVALEKALEHEANDED